MSAFPGYARLIGPEQYTIATVGQVQSPEDYRLWHTLVVTMRHGKPWDSPHPPGRVHVNEGRWVCACFWCKKGMLTRPDWAVAYCAECGARYLDVVFPANYGEIERVLCARPQRESQNWGIPPEMPDRYEQAVEELVRENREELGL